MTITVPGNLLLAGEYAITVPKGLGLFFASPHRISLHIDSNGPKEIVGLWGTGEQRWNGEDDSSLFAHIFKACRVVAGELSFRGKWFLDTRNFYHQDGRKKGLGSSAAASVALAAGFFRHLKKDEEQWKSQVFRAALMGHRAFQGGKGSGYDVAASTYGGLGLFVGGDTPEIHSIKDYYWPRVQLVYGDESVSTSKSITSFSAYKMNYPEDFRSFIKDNNRLVLSIKENIKSKHWPSLLKDYSKLSQDLGHRLGVNSNFQAPAEGWTKALGAGNEMALLFSSDIEEPLIPEQEGILWKS